jgi:putative membrane protein
VTVDSAPPVRRVHPLTPLLRSGLVVLAVGSWLLRNLLEGQSERRALLVVPVALVGALLLGLASWWFTRFRISPEELRIDSGVLVRRQRRVRIERIQAVEIEQPLLARVFAMAELRIEVAGGDGAKLAYLSLREAEALRRTLLDEARAGVPAPEAPAWQPVLFRVDDGRLLAATLLRSDVVSLLLVMVITGAFSLAMSQPGGLAGVFPAAVAAVGMAWRGFTRGYGTTLSRAERGLRCSGACSAGHVSTSRWPEPVPARTPSMPPAFWCPSLVWPRSLRCCRWCSTAPTRLTCTSRRCPGERAGSIPSAPACWASASATGSW